MMLLLIFLGLFVEQVSMMMITLPIYMPLVQKYGVDPVWFGVMFLICMQLGLLLPPHGLLLMTMKGVSPREVRMSHIFQAVLPYIGDEPAAPRPGLLRAGRRGLAAEGAGLGMERSFKQEVELLKLGDGETFRGEGILAVTKALLQSGVAYVGGYQGAPVSHLMDVLNDARDILDELGVHVETNASEAGAAAMLGASINYPLRGAVTFKSTVGTNVAADALSNLASAGVRGGALIVIGEDYGEGSSIIQERSQAFAMKSQMWLLDPRPNLPSIVDMVEKGFELSEASSTPVLLELRIRACHVHGSFVAKKNRSSGISKNRRLSAPDFDFARISLPPATYAQEKHKIDVRWPAAVAYIREHALNEVFEGSRPDVGIICQGGLFNATLRALQLLGLADAVRRHAGADLLHERDLPAWCPKRSWISAGAGSPSSSSRKASPPTSRTRCAPRCTGTRSTASR